MNCIISTSLSLSMFLLLLLLLHFIHMMMTPSMATEDDE
jgi:hypothetical protein